MGKDVMATYRKAANAYLAGHGGTLVVDGRLAAAPMDWSDPWLLVAVKTAQGDKGWAALEDVFAAGDALNHAIFTPAELDGGLARLHRINFLALDGAKCRTTVTFDALCDTLGAGDLCLDDLQEAIRKAIGAPNWSPARA